MLTVAEPLEDCDTLLDDERLPVRVSVVDGVADDDCEDELIWDGLFDVDCDPDSGCVAL